MAISNTRRGFLSAGLLGSLASCFTGLTRPTTPKPSTQAPLDYDTMRAAAIRQGVLIMPGTRQQHEQYIHARDGEKHDEIIRICRQYGVLGGDQNDKSLCPVIPPISIRNLDTCAQFHRDTQFTAYLRWFRDVDLDAYFAFMVANPKFRQHIPNELRPKFQQQCGFSFA